MKAYEVDFVAAGSSGVDVVICENTDAIALMLGHYKRLEIRSAKELSLTKVRVRDLSVASFINLMKEAK